MFMPGIVASRHQGGGVITVAIATPLDFVTTNSFDVYSSGGGFTVDWGNGVDIPYSDGSPTNVSSVASGDIIVKESGVINRIVFGPSGSGGSNTYSAIDIVDGTNLTSMESICASSGSLTSFSASNTQNVANMKSAWNSCTGLTSFPLIDTGAVTNFRDSWRSCSGLTTLPLLDLSSGTDFFTTFLNCTNMTSLPAVDTSSGELFTSMFQGCSSLVCLSAIDTLNQTDTTNMFKTTTSLVAPNASEQTTIEGGDDWTNSGACP